MEQPHIHNIFQSVFDTQTDAIFRFCLVRVSDREQALDLTQETFTRFWQSLQQGKKISNSRAFLFMVARRLIIDWYRKKKAVSLDGMINESENDAEASWSSGEYHLIDEKGYARLGLQAEGRYLLSQIEKLATADRDIIYMRFVEDLSTTEISEVMDISVNAVSVRINRSLEKLRNLTGYDIEESPDKI